MHEEIEINANDIEELIVERFSGSKKKVDSTIKGYL